VETEFHVVVRDGNRRGIRLERFFWVALKDLAESRRETLGHLVDEIAELVPQSGNLTSAIRVACGRWLADQNADLKSLTSLRAVNALLSACPSPAFALSSTKKILAFNPAFQHLVRRQLPMDQNQTRGHDLKLAFDLTIPEVFARLASDGDRPVVTGFVVGAADRRYRAQLSIVRAPLSGSDVLLAFVFG
jgi:predicted DNA-binding ribbon-helix-helix protein